ncbi:MAG: LuxR C-terminal-related transcriptional regulator [Myxococcales bacterium]
MQQLHSGDARHGVVHARLLLGQCAFQQGRLDEADAIFREALQQSRTHGGDDALPATARCLLARLECERGRYAEAADLLDGALEFAETCDGWFDTLVAGYETALTLARLNDASGRGVLRLLERIDEVARRRKLARLADLSSAWRLHLMLDQADPASVVGLIASTGAEPAFAHARSRAQHWRQVVTLGFALARWHFLSGRGSAALPLLRAVEADCTARGDEINLARCRARLALCLQQRGEIEAALPPLRNALDFIARTRAWQAIVDLGLPAKAMLRLARQHDPELGSGTTRAMTVQALLEKLQGDDNAGDETFSAREREVLAQLARGHSNKQIARNLHLSENTVKFHLKNLYKKLDADSRDAALATAALRGVIRA